MKHVLTALLLAFSSISFAECERPGAPSLPDGAVSDLATMVEGQKAVKSYVAGTEAYLECLAAEGEAAGEEATPEEQAARVDAHNAAVDEMEAVAGQFNEEIAEYKAKAQ
jgi:hypothetical protein